MLGVPVGLLLVALVRVDVVPLLQGVREVASWLRLSGLGLVVTAGAVAGVANAIATERKLSRWRARRARESVAPLAQVGIQETRRVSGL